MMLTAKDIMTRDVITVKKETPVSDLAEILTRNRISGAPVVDDAGKVIGIVTESDLVEQSRSLHLPTVFTILDSVIFLESARHFEKELRKMTGARVEDVYTEDPIIVTPDTSLRDIANIMAEKKIYTIPVVDGDRLVGIIGKADVVRASAKG
jgi:CBS domain-containing protein